MEDIIALAALICFITILVIELVWKKTSKYSVVTEKMILQRKRTRYIETFLMVFGAASSMYAYEFITGEEMSGLSALLLVGLLFGWNRTFFEPYYEIEVISDLDDFALYLRPFGIDKQSILQKRNGFVLGSMFLPEKLEKAVCSVIRDKIGMVYAIGDPNNASPTTLEASSIYANDKDWKKAVADLCIKAKIIILRIGDTEGCRWEILHCMENAYLQKTLFIADDYEDILFLAKHSVVALPQLLYEKDFKRSSVGIYLDNDTWCFKPLKTKKACERLIQDFLKVHPEIRKRNLTFKSILKSKSKSKWWDCLSIISNPVAYVLYNRWSTKSIVAFFTYLFAVSLFAIGCLFTLAEDEDEYIFGALFLGVPIFILSFIPWFWFAPKYTVAVNSWGGAKICAKANKTLALWMALYFVLTCLLTFICF